MNKAALAVLLALAACARPATGPLAGAAIGGPFALTDQDGRAVTDRSFAGQWRIMYFGYTFCPDICPTDMATLAQGLRRFASADPARAARVRLIFVSVDPERDTPKVLKDFAGAFGAQTVALTGTPQAIAKVAREFAISYRKQPVAGAAGYLMDHSRVAYLMDGAGKPVALLPNDGPPQAVADELAKWVT